MFLKYLPKSNLQFFMTMHCSLFLFRVDISVSRQGMFDDTYRRIPSEGWMFLPLVTYHGGGPAARFEPLNLHRTEYDFAFAQYFGAGVQGNLKSKISISTPMSVHPTECLNTSSRKMSPSPTFTHLA